MELFGEILAEILGGILPWVGERLLQLILEALVERGPPHH